MIKGKGSLAILVSHPRDLSCHLLRCDPAALERGSGLVRHLRC